MSDSAFKLQLLVRAEIALAKIYTRRSMLRAAFVVAALVFVLMALNTAVIVNVAVTALPVAYVVLSKKRTLGRVMGGSLVTIYAG
jgi:hypothetical protein